MKEEEIMDHVILADGNEMTVEIPKAEYRTLVEESVLLDTLVEGILRSANIGWDKKYLTFDDRSICALLAVIVPESYNERLKALQREKEEEEKGGRR